jgi:hypothetical protein
MSRGLNALLGQLKKAIARIVGRAPPTVPPFTDVERKQRLEEIRRKLEEIRQRNNLKPWTPPTKLPATIEYTELTDEEILELLRQLKAIARSRGLEP